MNCERIRQELMAVLAAGESNLSADLDLHLRACGGCHSFYQAEVRLLLSIEAGLGSMVNQPVPPSLLPRVREQLQETASRLAQFFALLPITAVLVIAALVAVPRLRHTAIPAGHPVTSISSDVSETVKTHPESSIVKRGLAKNAKNPFLHASGSQPSLEHEAATPDVIVGQDELRGLTLLASSIGREPALGKSLLNPVVPATQFSKPIVSQEIVPLEVATLEIHPLPVEDR